METQVWTDGSYSYGVGGWAWVSRSSWNAGRCVERASSTAMELRAILEAMRNNEGDLVIYSDHLGTVDLLRKARHEIHAKLASHDRDRTTLEHALRVLIFDEMEGRHVRFSHVRGHSGDKYNERADRLAKNARRA